MISPHGPDHPFRKLGSNERNEMDPNSSFLDEEFFKVPVSSKEEEMFRVSDWDRRLKYYTDPRKVKMMRWAMKQMDRLNELYDSKAWRFVA